MTLLSLIFILAFACSLTFIHSINRIGLRFALVSPKFMAALFLIFYTVLGMLVRYIDNDFFYVGRDFKDITHLGLISAFVFFIFFLVGYSIKGKKPNVIRNKLCHCDSYNNALITKRFKTIGLGFQFIGYAFLSLWLSLRGGQLGLFFSNELQAINAASVTGGYNGLILPFNMVIPGIILLYLARSRLAVVSLVLYILFSTAIGFRYRIVVVLAAVFVVTLLISTQRRIPLLRTALIAVGGISLIAIISMTRVYTQGLDLAQLANYNSGWDALVAFFSDINIILGVSAVIEYCEQKDTYLYFSPLIYPFIMFIPRFLWAGKPDPENFDLIVNAIGTDAAIGAGTAIPFWGEMFMSFGWLGIIIGSTLFGYISRKMFNLIFCAQENPVVKKLNIGAYSIFFGLIYLALSRGYLAQVLPEFVVTIFPMLLLRSKYFANIFKSNTLDSFTQR